jgi:hypothetical protein
VPSTSGHTPLEHLLHLWRVTLASGHGMSHNRGRWLPAGSSRRRHLHRRRLSAAVALYLPAVHHRVVPWQGLELGLHAGGHHQQQQLDAVNAAPVVTARKARAPHVCPAMLSNRNAA